MRVRASLFVLIALIVGLVSATPPVSAERQTENLKPYCTYSMSTHAGSCFQSERELLEYRAASTDYEIVAVYNWINYSLDRRAGYQIFSGNHKCTKPYDEEYFVGDLSSIRYLLSGIYMNNTISSVSTYVIPECDIKFWEHTHYRGDSSVWIDKCKNLATCTAENWYDRASSFKVS